MFGSAQHPFSEWQNMGNLIKLVGVYYNPFSSWISSPLRTDCPGKGHLRIFAFGTHWTIIPLGLLRCALFGREVQRRRRRTRHLHVWATASSITKVKHNLPIHIEASQCVSVSPSSALPLCPKPPPLLNLHPASQCNPAAYPPLCAHKRSSFYTIHNDSVNL